MKVAVFSTKPYDRRFLSAANTASHQLLFLEPPLNDMTAALAQGCEAVCVFVNDYLDRIVLEQLAANGTRLIALRCAGFNNVDLKTAAALGMVVARVPAYSPYAVSEHTVGLILTLNRRLHRAYARVREGNFALQGLLGFDLHGRTVGVIGTGNIGLLVCKAMAGFGCRVLAYDVRQHPDCVGDYVDLPTLWAESDIITLHCPLLPSTHHIISTDTIAQMKPGVMLINTSRGGLVDTRAVIEGLKSGQIAYLGLDVYEQEADLFFEDLSDQMIKDDVFERLLTFPNVVITGHQAFFTQEALTNIAETTFANIDAFSQGETIASNLVTADRVVRA